MVGVLNTALHWSVFLALVSLGGAGQGLANLLAFVCAATFSFFVNAKFTFQSEPDLIRYLGYVGVLGALAYLLGTAAQKVVLPPLVTLAAFSAMSLVIGFLYSRFIIFREARR
nr:GtrA family protein [Rubellimicrobium arenae]